MGRISHVILFRLLATCLLASCQGNVARTVLLQHDLGSGFKTAGSIEFSAGQISHASKLPVTWNVSPEDVAALNALASKQGLYTLQLTDESGNPAGPGGLPLEFSLPATCFRASLSSAHRLHVDASTGGVIVAFQWRHHNFLDCTAPGPLQNWPRVSEVKVQLPMPGHDLVVFSNLGVEDKPGPGVEMHEGIQPVQEQPNGNKNAPQKEKTFLERNWIYLLAFGLLVVNMMTKPQQQGGAGGAPVPQGARPSGLQS